jgi:hypothetical protein
MLRIGNGGGSLAISVGLVRPPLNPFKRAATETSPYRENRQNLKSWTGNYKGSPLQQSPKSGHIKRMRNIPLETKEIPRLRSE